MSVQYQKINHIITEQYVNEQAFLKEYNTGIYSFEAPFVKLNPYLIAPLTAIIMFKTESKVGVTVTVKGKYQTGDFEFAYPETNEHVVGVYGLYEDYNNEVILTLSTGESKTIYIQTEKAPADVKKVTKIETTAEYMGQNIMLVSPTTNAMTAAYDYKGDVRWYGTPNFAFDIKRVKNGRLLIGTNRLLNPPYHTTGLYEMGIIGKIYKEYRIPNGYHHDQFEMEDGNLLILTQELARGTVEDMCVLVDRKTGKIIRTWDYQKVLPTNVAGSGSQSEHDWFHNNAVWYDKKTNSLSFSGRHQDAIINIDYETGDLNWIIGDPEGWPQEMVDKYFFKPVCEEKFDWQYEQHACIILPDGDVFVFDNGHFRAKNPANYVAAKDNFSRGVRYRINTEDMTIEQVWQYGKERGEEFFSTYISNVEYYGEGHYMVHSGGIGTLNGETANIPPSRLDTDGVEGIITYNSITVELKDDVVVYEMQLPANYYRAEKLPLYCKEDTITFGKGELLGTLGVAEEMLTEVPAEEAGEVPDVYKVRIGEEEDRIVLKARFEKGQLVLMLFENENEQHRYYISTTKRKFLAMCVGTFQDSDERAVECPISKLGLNGVFDVNLIIDQNKYTTGIKITC